MMLLTAKNVAIFFGLAMTAFCISTIVLAVQKAELEDDLQDALDKLESLTTTTNSPTSPTVSTSSTSEPTISTDEPTETTNPTTVTSPTTVSTVPTPPSESTASTPSTVPTIPTPPSVPTFPTLPPNLTDPETITYRLPHDIRPIKYSIYYYPHLETHTFDGDVSIQIEIDSPTNLIALHSKNLNIDGISILNMMTRIRIRVKEYYFKDEVELLIIELEEVLFRFTPYTVSISYSGSLDGLTGMYTSSYINGDGIER